MGHLGREDANRPNRANRKNLSRKAQGQVGQMDANRPNRANQKFLSQAALGNLGKMDAVDMKEPKGPRTNQIMTRVTKEMGDSRTTGKFWSTLWEEMDTKLKRSTYIHPQIDGKTGVMGYDEMYDEGHYRSFENGKNSDAEAAEIREGRGKDETVADSGIELSVEEIFESKKVPPWREQMTLRGLLVAMLIGIMFSIIVMKLNLTTGLVPTMNVSAGLLGFILMRALSIIMEKFRLSNTPFTRQENTVIQTCVVACYSTAYGGGFGSYLLGMNRNTYEQAGVHTEGNSPDTIKEPAIGWMIGFLFVVTFIGILALVPLRKVLIIDHKLSYPSGTATAVLINGFHTPHGDILARKQVRCFGKYFTFSFLWGFFQWFFTAGENCGFASFPVFGLKAWKQSFYFDFSMTYVGAGMICPHIVNISLLIGAVGSWGIMWPLIRNQKGNWYPENLPESSMKSLNGYKVFVCIALILGDGLYNFIKIMYITFNTIYIQRLKRTEILAASKTHAENQLSDAVTYDQKRRNEMFMKESIPFWVAASGYLVLAAISVGVIPHIFSQMKWYYVFIAYLFAPVLAFCNAYGAGLTDQNLAYNYGKVALFVFAAWAGKDNGGVIVGLAACGIIKSILATASDLMQDFKTGYLTLSSPRSMFASQLIGTVMGCVVGPLVFWLFYKAFDVGNPDGEYKAPYALIYRNMAILGVEGFSALPKHCLQICSGGFALAFVINVIRDHVAPKSVSKYIPLPMAMAVPFLVGAYFAIDMCVGTVIVFVWRLLNRKEADACVPAVASGLICGDGVWLLPSSILALTKVKPPICMKFLSRHINEKVDSLLVS
ncbi:hypothetical protein KI387_035118 [Taxus chinensis]|uniref:Uncharacterized protein n=1 Tax=Taxus chinensis TaxID=29808 RepID=A0AA38KZQ8_TAXCH|nr:hypothetical protein KI387_035118 [Taxus chinensis]